MDLSSRYYFMDLYLINSKIRVEEVQPPLQTFDFRECKCALRYIVNDTPIPSWEIFLGYHIMMFSKDPITNGRSKNDKPLRDKTQTDPLYHLDGKEKRRSENLFFVNEREPKTRPLCPSDLAFYLASTLLQLPTKIFASRDELIKFSDRLTQVDPITHIIDSLSPTQSKPITLSSQHLLKSS